jgi:hypothetical protein
LGKHFRIMIDAPDSRGDAAVGEDLLRRYVFVHLGHPADKLALLLLMLHKLYAMARSPFGSRPHLTLSCPVVPLLLLMLHKCVPWCAALLASQPHLTLYCPVVPSLGKLWHPWQPRSATLVAMLSCFGLLLSVGQRI